MPIRPANTRSCSTDASIPLSFVIGTSSARRRIATPSVRSAWSANSSLVCWMAARRSGVSGLGSSPTNSREHRASSTSGAPLVNTICLSPRSLSRCSVDISLRSEENGTSATRGNRGSSVSARSPALRAATISAPSVGSPSTIQRPPSSRTLALFARSAAPSARSSSRRRGPSIAPPSSHRTSPSGE